MVREKRKSSPEAVAGVLDSLLDRLGLKQKIEERKLLEAWPQVVGEKIASHSRAIDIEDGVLTMQADLAVWRQELTLLVPRIKDRYNELFGAGTVREIRWDRSPRRRR